MSRLRLLWWFNSNPLRVGVTLSFNRAALSSTHHSGLMRYHTYDNSLLPLPSLPFVRVQTLVGFTQARHVFIISLCTVLFCFFLSFWAKDRRGVRWETENQKSINFISRPDREDCIRSVCLQSNESRGSLSRAEACQVLTAQPAR
jgi:hypothetical protein